MQPRVETWMENICISTFADNVVLLTSALGWDLQPQLKMFRYIRVLSTSEDKIKLEINGKNGCRMLYRTEGAEP